MITAMQGTAYFTCTVPLTSADTLAKCMQLLWPYSFTQGLEYVITEQQYDTISILFLVLRTETLKQRQQQHHVCVLCCCVHCTKTPGQCPIHSPPPNLNTNTKKKAYARNNTPSAIPKPSTSTATHVFPFQDNTHLLNTSSSSHGLPTTTTKPKKSYS